VRGKRETKLTAKGARNGHAARVHEAQWLHEVGDVRGVTVVVSEVSAIGQVKRLQEELDFIAFLPAKVVGNARIQLEGIEALHRVVADLAPGASLQAAEDSALGLRQRF